MKRTRSYPEKHCFTDLDRLFISCFVRKPIHQPDGAHRSGSSPKPMNLGRWTILWTPRTCLSSPSRCYSEKSEQQRSSVRTCRAWIQGTGVPTHLARKVRLEILLHLACSERKSPIPGATGMSSSVRTPPLSALQHWDFLSRVSCAKCFNAVYSLWTGGGLWCRAALRYSFALMIKEKEKTKHLLPIRKERSQEKNPCYHTEHHNSSRNSLTRGKTLCRKRQEGKRKMKHTNIHGGVETVAKRTTHIIFVEFLGVEHLTVARIWPAEQASQIYTAVQCKGPEELVS